MKSLLGTEISSDWTFWPMLKVANRKRDTVFVRSEMGKTCDGTENDLSDSTFNAGSFVGEPGEGHNQRQRARKTLKAGLGGRGGGCFIQRGRHLEPSQPSLRQAVPVWGDTDHRSSYSGNVLSYDHPGYVNFLQPLLVFIQWPIHSHICYPSSSLFYILLTETLNSSSSRPAPVVRL